MDDWLRAVLGDDHGPTVGSTTPAVGVQRGTTHVSVTEAGRGDAGGNRGKASGYQAVHISRDFMTLRRHFGRFVVPGTVFFLVWYFLYVIVAAFAPSFMRARVVGNVNVGLCFGVLQFVSAFCITITYRRWARRRLDPLSDRLRRRLEAGRQR